MTKLTDWLDIDSSQISRVRYNPTDTDTKNGVTFHSPSLEVVFRTGKRYKFKDVPEHKVQDMVHASSSGEWFMKEIRGCFDSERMGD